MPLRESICCRILVGSSATGSKKSSATQQNLLILSFVEKVSRFAPTVTDPLGLYKMSSKAYICEIEREWDREFPTIPPWPIDPWAIKKPMADEKNFTFVITPAKSTSPPVHLEEPFRYQRGPAGPRRPAPLHIRERLGRALER